MFPFSTLADLNESKLVRSYDRTLYQFLDEIFCKRRFEASRHLAEFLRDPVRKYKINQILEHEPVLSRYFSKEELGQLSLLWIALLGSYYDSAELLVRTGAEVNEVFGRDGLEAIDGMSTFLHLLLQKDPSPENERLISLIIDSGANFQARDLKGRSPLYLAVTKSRVNMIEMLLEKGADMNAATKNGLTPLFEAVKINAEELLPLFIKDVSAKDANGRNVLSLLAFAPKEQRTIDIARGFIEKGCSLEDREHVGLLLQPIHRAAQVGHDELVKLYLGHGADANSLGSDDLTPLYIAAANGHVEVVKTLLKHGANVNQRRSHSGYTALHAVCVVCESSRDAEVIELLLSAGADILIEGNYGHETPFAFMRPSFRLENTQYRCIRLLLRALALIKVSQPSIELKDETIIKPEADMQRYYEKCIEEAERAKSSRFIRSCTFFDLLTKCHCQIAPLMRNPEFETEFKKFNLKEFPMYAGDAVRAFKRAEEHYQSILEFEDLINESICYILPYMLVRQILDHIPIVHTCRERVK